MSAAMQQGLAALLVRKTEQGRTKARHSIEAWKKVTEAVRQTERKAEYKINLPNEQIQGVQHAAAQVRTANCVQVGYLENKAATARNALISTATEALEDKSREYQRTEAMAKQELQAAISKRDSDIAAAKQIHDAEIRRIYADPTGNIKYFQFDDAIFPIGTLALIIAFFVYTNASWNLLWLIVAWFALFVMTGIVIPDIVNGFRKARVKSDQRSRTAVAETAFKKAGEATEKRHREIRTVLEERRSQAAAHRKKVEEALQWFNAQT